MNENYIISIASLYKGYEDSKGQHAMAKRGKKTKTADKH